MASDGTHLMLADLQRPLVVGETVSLTLLIHTGETLTVPAVVRAE